MVFCYSSKYFYDILFISFREFAYLKKDIIIQQCENCKKYFIPATAHDTKYCDSIFSGKKTCKEIGVQKAYNEKLENDRLLKNGELDINHLLDLFQKLNLALNLKLQKCMNITKKKVL